MSFYKKRISAAVSLATVMLAGCSVTPVPLSTAENLVAGLGAQTELFENVEPVEGEIDLEHAIARALKYNRSRRVALMERVLSQSDLTLASYDMLPALSASAGYTDRSRLDWGSSATLNPATGEVSPPTGTVFSSSSDSTTSVSGELGLTWNALDFGLSYVRAGQRADSLLIAHERERKAIHNLIADIRSSYWRATSAQRLLKQIDPLIERVENALADSRATDIQRLQSPIDALEYQKELLDIQRTLQDLQRDLNDAETSLATLMGLRPGQTYGLKDVDETGFEVIDIALDIETLERTALARRPEIIENNYGQRISLSEGRAAILGLLPGVRLSAAANYDGNDYVLNDRWNEYGALLSFNLLNVFKVKDVTKRADAAQSLARERMLAMTASVLAQVHLAKIAYEQSRKEFETATEYFGVVGQLSEYRQRLFETGATGELPLIRSELTALLAELRRDIAYADLQNSYGRVFASAGLDPYTSTLQDDSVGSVAATIAEQFENWKNGDVGIVVRPLADQISPWEGSGSKEFTIAADTFSLGGQVALNATQLDGSALPSWMAFESEAGRFSGNPPANVSRLALKVEAQNASGVKANDAFEIALRDTNDAPELAGKLSIQVSEDEVATGQIPAQDADGDELKIALARGQSLPEGMTLNADGTWTFDATGSNYQKLSLGDSVNFTVRVVVTDEFGGEAKATLQIEVQGQNDAPVVRSQSINMREGGVLRSQIDFSDIDKNSELSIRALTSPSGFTIDESGRWDMDARMDEYTPLQEGDIKAVFVGVQVVDEHGATGNGSISISIEGKDAEDPKSTEAE